MKTRFEVLSAILSEIVDNGLTESMSGACQADELVFQRYRAGKLWLSEFTILKMVLGDLKSRLTGKAA